MEKLIKTTKAIKAIEVVEPKEISGMENQEEEALLQERKAKEEQIEKGDKVYFLSQKSPMTVKARSGRYAICTEPFYRQKTVYYSILDFEAQWKAPNDLVFNVYDYEDQASIDESLRDLMAGKYELSQRRGMVLDIDWERTQKAKAKRSKTKNKKNE